MCRSGKKNRENCIWVVTEKINETKNFEKKLP